MIALVGDRDPAASAQEMGDWRSCTTGSFRAQTLTGGHFFLHEHCAYIADMIARIPGAGEAAADLGPV